MYVQRFEERSNRKGTNPTRQKIVDMATETVIDAADTSNSTVVVIYTSGQYIEVSY